MELCFRDDRLRVYIAGPYSKGDVAQNVATALRVAEHVWLRGDVPFVPHLTHFWHFLHPHPWKSWLDLDLEWLHQCEGFLRIPGESAGADIEEREAQRLGLRIWHGLTEYVEVRGGNHP
jgi:hypothetical protein